MEPKEILIKKEQFIPIMKLFLEDIVNDTLLNQFSEEDLFCNKLRGKMSETFVHGKKSER